MCGQHEAYHVRCAALIIANSVILVKRGSLGGISEIPLLPLQNKVTLCAVCLKGLNTQQDLNLKYAIKCHHSIYWHGFKT
jgi:hypothetical protein